MILSGKAKLAGVMGWPVSHSRSPRLRGHWLERHGIDGAYVPLAVSRGRIKIALRALPVLGFRGGNLAVPHKEDAVAVCDGLGTLLHQAQPGFKARFGVRPEVDEASRQFVLQDLQA